MKKFENLKASEIKKAEAAANKYFGRKDCKVTGWSCKSCTEDCVGFHWANVVCEICFGYDGERADKDVLVSVFMEDRRRSFAMVY